MKKVVLALVILGGIAAGAIAYVKRSGPKDPNADVPTYTVTKEKFVRRVTAEGNLRAVKATPLSVPQQESEFGSKVAWLAPDGARIKKGDVVVRFDATEPEKQLRESQADLASAAARMGAERINGKLAVDGRDTTAVLADKELEQTQKFQQKDKDIYSRSQIIEAEIDTTLATSRKDNAEKTKQIERNLSRSKTELIGVESAKAQLAIKNAKTALSDMEIRAPHDGLFVLQRNWKGETLRVGDQLWPGQKVAEIPLLETMEAEVFVLEVDGSGLLPDQLAEITIEAHPDTVYKGKIKLVDKLAKPRVYKVPVQYFAVVVALETTDNVVMKPGARVDARLVLDETDALIVPRQAIGNKDGKSFVYRRSPKGAFEQVVVELGAATSGRVVVKSGLAAGDVIAMRDPTKSADSALGSGADAHGGGGGGGGGGDPEIETN